MNELVSFRLTYRIVRNWEFQRPVPSGLGGEVNPLKLLRRRSSLVVDDRPVGFQRNISVDGEAKKPKAAPTMFEEPDANSLLDSFGF